MEKVYVFSDYMLELYGNNEISDTEQLRRALYCELKEKLEVYSIVSPATLKLWCGIGGQRKPSREKMFQMAVVLGMTQEELQMALKKGMQEPGVQINDYREVICYYGLAHALTLEECEAMIHIFETQMQLDIVLEQKTHTEELWNVYTSWERMDKEHFLYAMCEQAGKFKGYSKTTLNCFVECRNEIIRYVRMDAYNQLMSVLGDTDFFTWIRHEGKKTIDYEQQIKRFLKNEKRKKNSNITKEQIGEIEYFYWIAYAGEARNTDLIKELYAGVLEETKGMSSKTRKIHFKARNLFNLSEDVKFMSNTYLSHLLNISGQKECEIRLTQLYSKLQDFDDSQSCPMWMAEVLQKYFPKENIKTCKEAKKLLHKKRIDQQKRCVLIERKDILPLLHCLAQKKYTEKCQENTIEYNRETAKKYFVETANATLLACGMSEINEDFAFDRFLLSSFTADEMLSYSELIEQTANI